MSKEHGLAPAAEHYLCMADLLDRAGHLDEAEELVVRLWWSPGPSASIGARGGRRS